MKIAIAKYPIKIGDALVPAGAKGTVIESPTSRISSAFPGLTQIPNGELVLVKFGEIPECLLLKKQVTISNETS